MSANLTALKNYLENRFIGFPADFHQQQICVRYKNSEGLLFVIEAREGACGVSLCVITPLMLLNPRAREQFEQLKARLASTLTRGRLGELGVSVDQDDHVCAWANLGTDPVVFPNEAVEAFIEGALGLPVAFKKFLF